MTTNIMNDIFVALKNKNLNPPASGKPVISFQDDSQDINTFSSFCQNPKGASFQTQKPNETIILFLRSHFVTNISWLIFTAILIGLPPLFTFSLPLLRIDLLSSQIIARFITTYVLFYYLMVSSYVFISFLHWFYNVFIVSSERVVDIDYSDIVIHNIAITNLSHIEDVNYTQSGFIPTFLNYGNVFVQTAGNERNFEALSVPKPREATHIISDLLGKA